MRWMQRIAGVMGVVAGLAGAAQAAPIVREGGIRPPSEINDKLGRFGRLGIADGTLTVRGGGIGFNGRWVDYMRFGIDGRDGKQVNVTLGKGRRVPIRFDSIRFPKPSYYIRLYDPDGHRVPQTSNPQILQFATTVQRGEGLYVLQVLTRGRALSGPGFYAIDVGVTPIPPAAALLATPLLGLGWLARRRRTAAQG